MKRWVFATSIALAGLVLIDDIRLRRRVAKIQPVAQAGLEVCFGVREHYVRTAAGLRSGNDRERQFTMQDWDRHKANAIRCLQERPMPPEPTCAPADHECLARYADAMAALLDRYREAKL